MMDDERGSEEVLESLDAGNKQSFTKNFIKDLTNKRNWKLKFIYFFLLSGIVILWAQLTIHQSTLNLSDRDISDFASTSSVFSMVIPFISGMVADKIGNFSYLVSSLTVLMGITSFFFILIPPVKITSSSTCSDEDTLIDSLMNVTIDLPQQAKQLSIDLQLLTTNKLKYCSSNGTDVNSTDFGLRQENLTNSNCSHLFKLKNLVFEYVINGTKEKECNRSTGREIDKTSHSLTYWSYMLVRTSFIFFAGAVFTLFEGAVMAMNKEYDIDYGLQRAWGTLAAMVSSYAGGFLVDFYSEGKKVKDFTLMFFGSGVCCIIAGLFMFSVSIKFKLPATHFSKAFLADIYKFEALALLSIVLLKGLFMGYAETFMYLFMFNLGANSALVALTITVAAPVEFLLQLLATPITKSFGKVFVIFFGVFLYAVRFMGFSYVYDPRVIVGLEILDSWASGLTFTAVNMYCTCFASTTTIASIRGLAGALHDGIGKFIGVKVGIEIKEFFGDRNAWKVMAGWALASSVGYALLVALYRTFIEKTKRKKTYTVNASTAELATNEVISKATESQ